MTSTKGSATTQRKDYDVVVVGGGVSGTALLFTLSRYTSIPRLALLEKYDTLGAVSSAAHNNSQTLHLGDIETNYSIEKTRQVYTASSMVSSYIKNLPQPEQDLLMRFVQKIVLGVGQAEATQLEERFEELIKFIPGLELLNAEGIASAEPAVMRGRDKKEVVRAIKAPGQAINYGELAKSFIDKADKRADILLETKVINVKRIGDNYVLKTNRGEVKAQVVIFNTDAYSLGFAKQLGLGKEFSLIPIAGTFYFTPTVLRGKVYRVQNPKLPFAAIHGDPDLTKPGVTRFGPTARLYPALEPRKLMKTAPTFFASSGFNRPATWLSFAKILLDPLRFWYLFRNIFYELPIIGKWALLPNIHKIVPSIKAGDLTRASSYGGMRLQRVNTKTGELLLGEGKIVDKNIIFNMSPSPGASVCLHNAMRDAEQIAKFLPQYPFKKEEMLADLGEKITGQDSDVSQSETYAS